MFGSPVYTQFNLNRTHTVHKTRPGGMCSIVLRVFIFVFVVIKALNFINTSKDVLRSKTIPTDFSMLGPVNIRNAGVRIFFQLRGLDEGPLDITT